jgi:glycosyltransferase involved in cell wall biosynthesis
VFTPPTATLPPLDALGEPAPAPRPPAARRRILLATPWYPTAADPAGGAFCRDNVLALRAAGHTVRALHVAPGVTSRSDDDVVRVPYPATRRGALPLGLARATTALVAAARAERPDLIHAHVTLPVGAAAALVGRLLRRPIVLSEHTGPFASLLGTPLRRALVGWTLRSVAAVVPVSRALRDEMAPFLPTPGAATVVPNPVDLAAFAAVGPPPQTDRLLFVGRLVPEKRLDDLLAALHLLRQRRPAATLRIVGDGPVRARLARALRESGELPGVLAGRLDRAGVAAELAAADLLVLPSQVETFGVVLVEALAAGRPVVATQCGGPEEIVDDAVGALVPVGDPARLADAIDATLTRRFEPAALRGHAARWSYDAFADRLAAIYERALPAKAKP